MRLPQRLTEYRPNPPLLWRVPDALAHMRMLLAGLPQDAALEAFLLVAVGQGSVARLQRRAVLASTLVAGLELSRDGAAALEQDVEFGEIRVSTAAWG